MDEIYGAEETTFTGTFPQGSSVDTTLPIQWLLKLKTVPTGVSVEGIDYADGIIKYSATDTVTGDVTVVRSVRDNKIDAFEALEVATGESLSATQQYEALVYARAKSRDAKETADVCVLSPEHEGALLRDNRFIDASAYGDRRPIVEGEIGRAAGMAILPVHHGYTGAMVVLRRGRAGVYVLKREVTLRRKEIPEKDSHGFYFYSKGAPRILHEDAVWLIFNPYGAEKVENRE